MYLKNICFFVCYLCIFLQGKAHSETIRGRIVAASSGQGIPFVKLLFYQNNVGLLTDTEGNFKTELHGKVIASHPFYESKTFEISQKDSVCKIALTKKEEIPVTEDQLDRGYGVLAKYHENMAQTSSAGLSEFEFLSYFNIEVFRQPKGQSKDWEHANSLESMVKNRYKYPNKKYARVIKSHYHEGDSSATGFIPINTYSVSENNEYIDVLDLKFYNPLFENAHRRYAYALVDSILWNEKTVHVIFFKPKPDRHFVGLTGLLYYSGDRFGNWGGFWFPSKKSLQNFTISYYQALTSKNTRFLKNLSVAIQIENIPNFRTNSMVKYTLNNTLPNFEIKNTSGRKWLDMVLFDNRSDTTTDDTWLMTQMMDKEKLTYIEKDTLDDQFLLTNTLKRMYTIYQGKLGYRVRLFDVNNVFAINGFEAVRVGIGLQSHENLSDVFTFGGYAGYGIGDQKFKYGGNTGVYFGPFRNHFLSVEYKKDLLEPGLTYFLNKKQDLVRNFFTNRMDDYQSAKVSFRTTINAYITYSLLFNNYSLRPLYDYVYTLSAGELTGSQNFDFTETSILFSIRTPFAEDPNLRNILFRKTHISSNLDINLTRGWKTDIGGKFDYWKINGRFSATTRLNGLDALSLVVEGGYMTTDQPYQIMYGGPGTEFKLTGIIINNSFQTMKLYGFFADRFAHSFINYNLGNVIFKKFKFKPELALALNFGWGRIHGSKEIHKNIEVRDYPDGYYEAGILLNNLLRLRFYKYFYGGLGLGTFIGFGPDAEKGAFAVRLAYDIGTL